MGHLADQGKSAAILDATLRDGSYTIDFQFTADDTAVIASALESAGVRIIEVGHGVGLGAARAGKGDAAATDEAYLRAAAEALREADFGTFYIPGIAEEDDLRRARDLGMGFVRVGTNITEMAEGRAAIGLAKRLGLDVSANLMKSYAVSAEAFGACAQQAAAWGADVVCLVDSAGCMLPEEVGAYIGEALARDSEMTLGFHGHDNLNMATACTLEAHRAGARVLDATLQGMGRSEGNVATEVLAAILQKRGLATEIDVNALLDISEAFVRPLMHAPRRSSLGITTGRARFHSSFLGRVMAAATAYGIDPRELILRVGERDPVDAPAELVAAAAQEIAAERPRAPIRVDPAASAEQPPGGFEDEVTLRAQELREKGCKHGLPSVLNVVVTRYEVTRVSPFVETRFGCALSNVMLAEGDRLPAALAAADPYVDYVLADPGDAPFDAGMLRKAVPLLYSDHEMWARTTAVHLTALLEGSLSGRTIAVTGTPGLARRAAVEFAAAGARVALDPSACPQAMDAPFAEDGRIAVGAVGEAAAQADAVVSLSPRRPAVDSGTVARMRPGALLYDGGIGSLAREAVPAAEARGIRVVRIDMRPSLAATALERMGMRRIVREHMGRATWDGVSVVAGGLIGGEGEVIVDSVSRPTRVVGVADGRGGVLHPEADAPAVRRVRRVIAQKMLEPEGRE